MAVKPTQRFTSTLKTWIQKYQITLINSSVTVILIGIVIFVLLSRASALQRRTSEESMMNLAGMAAYEIQSYYQTYFDMTRSLARIITGYEGIEPSRRRIVINDMMLSILNSNRSLVSVYTLWQPNILDDMDADFSNTSGHDETGQFTTGFTRERGFIEQRAFPEFRYLLDINYRGLNLMDGIISEPFARTIALRDTWVIDIQVPIMQESLIFGVIGLTINLEQLQFMVEPIKPYKTGRTMVVSSNGTIFAHNDPGLRGVSLLSHDDRDPMFSGSTSLRIFQTMLQSIYRREPLVYRTNDTLLVCYPLKTVNPLSGTNFYNSSGDAPWAVITSVPMETVLEPINTLLRFSIMFIAGAGIVATVVVFLSSSSLTQRARALQYDLERATIMQDSLKYGLFMMDQKYVIQGAYSKAVEKILSISNLQGKVFINLLSSSLKANEQNGLADYFEMVYNNSYDKEMLESINPINVFTYVSTETGEMKNLRTSFTTVERVRGSSYILCTLEDITAEKELEQQLLNVENQREKEMQSLFQVIQLNPRVLSDFIEDTEFEFEAINEKLKNKTHFHREVLVEMYQSIHAIKSNALILNLENFANRLHKLETTIRNLQEKYEDFVPFDDFLDLVLELDEAMKEKDQLKSAISKIQGFKTLSGEDKSQDQYVLVESLNQICQKSQETLNKKVKLVVESIDDEVLDHGPRRIIKEVLTQMVRNAIYHGIETPEEREPLGKDPVGEIKISLKHLDNNAIIKVTDNGKGIDFKKIRQIAEAFNMFSDPNEANDKNFLLHLLFSPGFSTVETADLHAGRGMGLSLVKDRLKEIHGTIKVSTAAGRGTTFTISIPMDIPVIAHAS